MRHIPQAILVALLAVYIASAFAARAASDTRSGKASLQNVSEDAARETGRRANVTPCAQPVDSCSELGDFVLAKTSTFTSKVRVLTGRYESNLRKIMDSLPDRWDLVAVLKWSAYGNDIAILGPIAARIAPALAVLSNEEAATLAPFKPKSILRIGPASYQSVKESVIKGFRVQEFIGTLADLETVTRVAKEHDTVIDASIFLFDHYGNPLGFDFKTPEDFQHLIDSIDRRFVRVRGIFSHLGELPPARIPRRVQRFLRIACPVATKVAATLAPDDPPIMVHWGATDELGRLRNPKSGKLEIPPDLVDLANVCLSEPKVKFGIRVGAATFGIDTDIPNLQPVLWWTAPVDRLRRSASTTLAVVRIGTENGYPRFFKQKGKWGEVSIGGRRYPLAAAPGRDTILVKVGLNYDNKTIFVGVDVCLLCDELSVDDLYENWVAAEQHDIAICATGAGIHFADDPLLTCKGPVVIAPDKD
jgi:alanine racemase